MLPLPWRLGVLTFGLALILDNLRANPMLLCYAYVGLLEATLQTLCLCGPPGSDFANPMLCYAMGLRIAHLRSTIAC